MLVSSASIPQLGEAGHLDLFEFLICLLFSISFRRLSPSLETSGIGRRVSFNIPVAQRIPPSPLQVLMSSLFERHGGREEEEEEHGHGHASEDSVRQHFLACLYWYVLATVLAVGFASRLISAFIARQR